MVSPLWNFIFISCTRASVVHDRKLLSSAYGHFMLRRSLSTSSPRFQQNIQSIEPEGLFYKNYQLLRIPPSTPHGGVESLCMIHSTVYYHILGTYPEFPKPIPPIQAEKCYVIKPIRERGLGVVATRNIEPGEIIVSERPVLLLPEDIPYMRFQSRPMTVLWNRLSTKQSAVLEGLFNCTPPPPPKSPADVRKGIIDTNALGLQFFSGPEVDDMYAGIFPEIARCNHSCTPNAIYNFDPPCLAVHLTASQPIAQGDEITITYITPLLPRASRRTQLAKYKFSCTCPSCILPHDQSLRSDALRTLIYDWVDLTGNIEGWETAYDDAARRIISSYELKDSRIEAARISLTSPSTTPDHLHSVIRSGKQYYELCTSEDVHTDYIYQALERVAFAYALLGEEDHFKEWGQRARVELRVLGCIAVGKSNFTDEQWGKALDDPIGFIGSWGKKKALT